MKNLPRRLQRLHIVAATIATATTTLPNQTTVVASPQHQSTVVVPCVKSTLALDDVNETARVEITTETTQPIRLPTTDAEAPESKKTWGFIEKSRFNQLKHDPKMRRGRSAESILEAVLVFLDRNEYINMTVLSERLPISKAKMGGGVYVRVSARFEHRLKFEYRLKSTGARSFHWITDLWTIRRFEVIPPNPSNRWMAMRWMDGSR